MSTYYFLFHCILFVGHSFYFLIFSEWNLINRLLFINRISCLMFGGEVLSLFIDFSIESTCHQILIIYNAPAWIQGKSFILILFFKIQRHPNAFQEMLDKFKKVLWKCTGKYLHCWKIFTICHIHLRKVGEGSSWIESCSVVEYLIAWRTMMFFKTDFCFYFPCEYF